MLSSSVMIDYWGAQAACLQASALHGRCQTPTTRAFELRKGSADVAISALTADTVLTLEHESHLEVLRGPGTIAAYLAFNLRDPILKDVRVRQAIACAIDRTPDDSLFDARFRAAPAYSLLPTGSWAYNGDVPHYDYRSSNARPTVARRGWISRHKRRSLSYRNEDVHRRKYTRLIAAVLQQQLRERGHRTGHSHFRICDLPCRRDSRGVSSSFSTMDRGQRRSRHF